MPSIAPACHELRVQDEGQTWRIVYRIDSDAIVILERTRTVMQKANHDYGGHRAAAVRDLGGAIQQLKTALKYEKKKR